MAYQNQPSLLNQKLKILILGTAYPFRGGLANYNERLARAFQALGHETEIFTFLVQYPSFLFPGKSQYSSEIPPLDIKIAQQVNSINPLNWISAGIKIRNKRPDILLIKYWLPFMAPCFGSIARVVKNNHHTKVITILDNVLPHEKRAGDKLLTNYYIRASDGFIAMSQSVLKDLRNFTNVKPAVFNPHPLYDNFGEAINKEAAKNNLSLQPTFNYLLFFGFIRRYKGLDLLLHAMANERLRKLPVKLIVAGEFYEAEKYYLDLIERLHLQQHVILRTNFIPDNEVKNYFSAVDLVVQPYRHATQSGVTQIAYQFNKPMIVTNVGGLPELVPDGKVGYVIKPDASEISKAIIDFYEQGREQVFSRNIIEEKSKFSWEQMVNTIQKVYSETRNSESH
ncbi:MAG: glycosyltransferase [Chitinophagales bacterium]|nr:glycosyltransferase [Chitinophagales bacterium]